MNSSSPSLTVAFGISASLVTLRAGSGRELELRRLAARFQSTRQRSQVAFDLELDDLLTNLVELASWPFPESVEWAPDLRRLAEDVTRDAQAASASINDDLHREGQTIAQEQVLPLLGESWIGNLTRFQQRDVAKLLSLRHGANFSVPGAGKTRVGLALFQALRNTGEVQRLLIVGPKSSYEAWTSEGRECFRDGLEIDVLSGAIPVGTNALIVNYDRLPATMNSLAAWLSARPSLLILDEAHRMKLGAEGAHGAACLALGPRAHRRLILSGTPAPNGVKDLENLFGFVWPGQGRLSVTRAVADGNLSQASAILRPLFTRTTKKELDLPEVSMALRTMQLPPIHREIYDALISQFSSRAIESRDDFQALGRITMYLLMAATSPALLTVGTTRYEPLAYQVPPLQVPGNAQLMDLMKDLPTYEMSPKYQETLAIVARNAALGRKTLVWSTFVRSLNTLNGLLQEFKPVVIHGGTEDRTELIDRFRNDPDCMVLLSNPATLGEGISLHRECHDAIYVDRDFAAGRFLQSLDRIHRLGLEPGTATRVTVLSSAETIDEIVVQRLEQKLKFMGRILDDPAVEQLGDLADEPVIGGGMDWRDLRDLMGHLRAPTP